LRGIIGMALVIGIMTSLTVPTLADTTTGNIAGQVTSNGQPVGNVSVTAIAPSGRYTSKTDAKGFYSIVGVQPDTYTVTFASTGYADTSINGVTVNPTITTTVNQSLASRLKTIGTVSSRASGVSAFQPQQPVDTYSINGAQIQTALGKPHGTSETGLLTSLPGATLDVNGYPVIRGGRENDEGFQFEGIDYTDAFTSQFVNGLNLNGVQSFQLTPGAGDASVGNAGTGQINITVKRGARPAFASAEQDISADRFNHQFAVDYGFATPNGRLSNYLSFTGQGSGYTYGNHASDLEYIGRASSNYYRKVRDLIDNAIFKFGRDNSQSLQLLYQNQTNTFYTGANFPDPGFRTTDPVYLFNARQRTGLTNAEIEAITPLEYGQSSILQTTRGRPLRTENQPNETMKLQYSNAINASTYVTAKFYKVNATAIFDIPYNRSATYSAGLVGDTYSLQGGQRTGFAIDATKQLGSQHLLGIGGKYEFLHPIDSYYSASVGFFDYVFGGAAAGATSFPEVYDFLPATSPSCTGSLSTAFGVNPCGYLSAFFPGGIPRLPAYDQSPIANRHDWSAYISDQFQASDKLKFNLGLRVDGTKWELPSLRDGAFLPASGNGYSSGSYFPTAFGVDAAGNPLASKDVLVGPTNAQIRPAVLEPRLGFAYQFTPRDSVTFSYGRSTQFPPIADVDDRIPRAAFAPFVGIPANATACGPTGDRACRDYADQLYWENQNVSGGVPIIPTKPTTFSNFDASLQHDFGHGVALKLTPFFRRGYDVVALVATPKIVNGVAVVDPNSGNAVLNPSVTTNLGVNKTTGVEFYLTKTATYGLSGTLSMTYINEFSNVVPTTGGEDFFPSIPPASLALGNLYRVGFISPFNAVASLQYKWRSGWRLNPILSFENGYPYGTGLISAIQLRGQNYNVPQTNVTNDPGLLGSNGATQYVDPANPGTVFRPNIAATRGTPEGNSAGGKLSNPRLNATLSLEYNRPGTRNTIGVLVGNLFNQLYEEPLTNTRYQPVATGIGGAVSGTNSNTARFGPNLGYVNLNAQANGFGPYVFRPNQTPRSFRFYYQYAL
jgi:hypothetical protein